MNDSIQFQTNDMSMNVSQHYLGGLDDYNYNNSGRDYVNMSNGNVILPSNHNQSLSSYANVTTTRTEIPIWLIPCYSIILLAAIVGNLLVISTLVQNRRMRTITNVFLLNLAISDILLGVFCMPVTLVGTLLRRFIFGEFLCKLIQFSQATSVAVSSWTLVAISCERYYAICHPLRSRTWQTISHAYKIIAFIWIGSIICMVPIAAFSQLIPTSRQGLSKCREMWPKNSIAYERFYNILLDLFLLVLPLMILCVAYILITRTLYIGMQTERALIFGGSTKISSHAKTVAAAATHRNAPSAAGPLKRFNSSLSFRCFSISRGPSVTNSLETFQQETRTEELPSGKQRPTTTQQQQQQQQRRRQQQQPQHGYDENLTLPCKRKLLTDGGKQFYYIRSDSVKSLNRDFKQSDDSVSNVANVYGENNGKNNCTRTNNDYVHVRSTDFGCTSEAGSNTPHSMTVINVPQQQRFQLHQQRKSERDRHRANFMSTLKCTDSALRRSNGTKTLESKKRVVKMLFVLVLEFFICWTPLYVINTTTMFIGQTMYEYVDYTSISFLQLLAYSSSCCNPITYCFMNAGFRRAFVDTFKGMQRNEGRFWSKRPKSTTPTLNSGAANSLVLTTTVTLLSNHTLESPRR